MSRLTKAFMIRPMIKMTGGKMRVRELFFGSESHAWKAYIAYALKKPETIDKRYLFVTYIGLTKRELDFIREEVEKRMSFDRIYFQAGSPGIAVNVGPGTFGLIYLRK